MSEIAVIGDEDLILGLKVFGFDTFFAKEDKVKEIFREILEKDYKIYFIQEIYFPKIKDFILGIKEKPFPLILPFPDHREIKGVARELLREITLKAVGQDILK